MEKLAHGHDYAFTTAPEVIDKIQNADNLHEQIPEESASGLAQINGHDVVEGAGTKEKQEVLQ